jgi:hypothetical protein
LTSPVRPKNSAEVRWKIEPQGLLKDSPFCDDATLIPPHPVLSKNSNDAKAEWLRASLLQRWM